VKKLSLILSILAIVFGAIAVFFGVQDEYSGGNLAIIGTAMVVIAIAVIVVIFMYPSFGESMQGLIVSLLVCVGTGSWALEMYLYITGSASTPFYIIGLVTVGLSFILCPCMCMQSGRQSRGSVIGVAAAHESITITEISQKTGLSKEIVSKTVYDAIGKGQLAGRMDGDTFKKTAPSTTAVTAPGATVLVICPYCGAKTEQGLAKCQKCGADI
jgi:hypothetical protein